jgi:hypothetical protein
MRSMSRIRLAFDEGCHATGARRRLCARRVDVLTASDCGMVGRSDEEHLRYAGGGGRVLYSFNIRDYSLLHKQWTASAQEYSGIILALQQRYPIGEQLRRLLYLLNQKSAVEMLSRLEYLSSWGR